MPPMITIGGVEFVTSGLRSHGFYSCSAGVLLREMRNRLQRNKSSLFYAKFNQQVGGQKQNAGI